MFFPIREADIGGKSPSAQTQLSTNIKGDFHFQFTHKPYSTVRLYLILHVLDSILAVNSTLRMLSSGVKLLVNKPNISR